MFKNKFKKSLCFLSIMTVLTLNAYSDNSEYGSFNLKVGSGYIVRLGKKIELPKQESFVIFNNDLIKLGEGASGTLVSKEKATIDIGSNAVLKVRSWESEKSSGFLSLLYGKIKATIAGLRSEESFNIKTANSIIGVKGTEYSAGTSESGDSFVWTISDYTYLTDTLRSRQMIVPSGYYASNFSDDGLQKMIAVDQKGITDDTQLASSALGEDKKMSFTDNFFVKRTDVGNIPQVNQGSFNEVIGEVNRAIEDLRPQSIIQINISGTLR